MPRPLKVYRTPIGFHDALVAAQTKKAALAAWGADHDLFARGLVEEVDDPALTAKALAEPGRVFKVLRGTDAEHFAALPDDEPTKAAPSARKPQSATAGRRAPKPSRKALNAAETEIAEAEAERARLLDEIDTRAAQLEHERRAVQAASDDRLAHRVAARDRARAAYDTAVRRWRG